MFAADGRAIARARWLHVAVVAGVVLAAVVAAVASGDSGLDRSDSLRSGAASLLLLGGMALGLYLGGSAFAGDARSGYLGLLVGSGATPSQVGAGRLLVRVATLVAVMGVWGVALQGASLAVGEGLDGPLAVHTLANLVNIALILCATAAMASVIGPVAAGAFGAIVFVSAQAAVNLKAALDQGAVASDSSSIIDPVYALFPRALVSPMINDLQQRDAGGPAAPRLDVNGIDVIVPTSPPLNVVWTLIWVAALGAVAVVGVRRRQLT